MISDGDHTLDELEITVIVNSVSTRFETILNSNELKVIPPENFVGNASIKVMVVDPDNQISSSSFTLEVLPQNDLPVFSMKEKFTVNYNTQFQENIIATDIDGDKLELAIKNIPAWLTFLKLGAGLGLLQGTPKDADAGTYDLTAEVNDGTTTVSKNFKIQVLGSVKDNAPIVKSTIEPINLPKESAPINIDLSNVFTDADGDSITISVVSNTNPDWLLIGLNGKNLTISISNKQYTGVSTIGNNNII